MPAYTRGKAALWAHMVTSARLTRVAMTREVDAARPIFLSFLSAAVRAFFMLSCFVYFPVPQLAHEAEGLSLAELPTAPATTLVVTLSSGMLSSLVTVPKIDRATPTEASCVDPAHKQHHSCICSM
jgi:hypothetical protein